MTSSPYYIRLTPYTVYSHGENQLSQLKLVGMLPGSSSSRAASNAAGQVVGPDGKLIIPAGGPATTAKADEVSTVAAVIKAGTFDLFDHFKAGGSQRRGKGGPGPSNFRYNENKCVFNKRTIKVCVSGS